MLPVNGVSASRQPRLKRTVCVNGPAAPLSEPILRPRTSRTDLPSDLQRLVDAALHALCERDAAESTRIVAMTAVARAFVGRRVSGTSALSACARGVGVSRQVMQEYATIAARWSAAQLDLVLGLRDANARPIGMSRLVLIARAPTSSRDALLRRVVATGLSARQLRALLAPKRHLAVTPARPAFFPSEQQVNCARSSRSIRSIR